MVKRKATVEAVYESKLNFWVLWLLIIQNSFLAGSGEENTILVNTDLFVGQFILSIRFHM